MAMIASVSPIDGSNLGEFTLTSAAEINQQIQAARLAGKSWSQLSVKARLKRLAPLNQLLLANADILCDCISQTSGKVTTEALLGELIPVLELNRFYQKQAQNILKTQPISTSPLMFPFSTAKIERRPFGVVAIISPWNYPFQLSVAPIVTALIAGNAVLLKVSELSLPVGKLIIDLFKQLDLPADLVQWVVGNGETGQQLLDAGPDLVFFTGSLASGQKVMRSAAQHPIPVLMELGGKDAMLVFADANLNRACNAAIYGGFCNSGQVCMSIERLYVQQACFDRFLAMLLSAVQQINIGHGEAGDLGAICDQRQFEIIKAHYDDALAQGAKASGPLVREGNYLRPVVLWQVHHGMRVMREESFGPLLPVMAFAEANDAIQLANHSEYGLNCSIWSQHIGFAKSIASQLQTGNWVVNDVLKNVGHPGLPFGGVKKSGFGRYRGAEGLRSFSYPVAGLTNRSALSHEPNWFPYSKQRYALFKSYLDFVYSSDNMLLRLIRNWSAIFAFRHYARLDIRQSWQNIKQSMPWKQDY